MKIKLDFGAYMPYAAPSMELVMALDDTERGADGFGSTVR